MKTLLTVLAVAGLHTAVGLHAYTIESAHWPAGSVSFYLNLSPAFNAVAADKLAVWDQYTGATRLRTTNDATTNGNVWFMDGRNTIEWSSDVGWDLPGNVLGVASFYSLNSQGENDGVMREADILINTDFAFSDYLMGRVLLHEIGHAIGLGHSEYGDSIMFPYIGASELSADDIAGAKFLYGPAVTGNVPDAGSTAALFGGAIVLLSLARTLGAAFAHLQ